jgi:hypothetical protein
VIDHPKDLGLHFFSISIQEFLSVCTPFFWVLETSDKLLLLGTQTRGSFFFFFFFVCILDVSTCSWHYVVAEAGCNWYPININIFALSKKSDRKKHSRFKIMKVIYYNLSMIFNMELNRFVCFKFSDIVKLWL